MKAAQINSYGRADAIVFQDAPKPEPKEGQVLIEVYASSVNPFDDKIMAGMMKAVRPLDFPFTPGEDVAGVVAIGNDKFKKGDRVWADAGIFGGGSGAMAEFAVAKSNKVGHMPKNLGFREAGTLPLVGVSALQALEDHIELKKGQKIFISGGAGGIGTIAIQLAKHLGAYVITTASSESTELVKGLGADEVIDYKTEDFRQKVHSVDAVFDTVGGESNAKAYEVIKRGGIIVAMSAPVNEELMKKYDVRAVSQGTTTTTETLDRLARLVDTGAIKPVIQKVYPLAETAKAFAAFEAGGLKGKIGIRVR